MTFIILHRGADMAKVRRAIKVWGAQMDDGRMVTNDDPSVVSVTIHPDGHVSTTDPSGKEDRYQPEFCLY